MSKKMNTDGFDWYYGQLKDKCKSAEDKSWLAYVNRWGCALQKASEQKTLDWRQILDIGNVLDPEHKNNYTEALIAIILAWNRGDDIIEAYHDDRIRARNRINSERRAYNYEIRRKDPKDYWLIQEAVFAKAAVSDELGKKRKEKYGRAMLSGNIRPLKRMGCERVIE